MQKLFQKNIKFLYKNLPHYYKLITSIKEKRFLIKNNNIFDTKTNTFIYPNSIEEDSKKFAYYPTHNELWTQEFAYIHPHVWNEEKFFITGKTVNKLIKKYETLPHTNGFYFDKNFLPTTVILGILAGKHIDMLVDNFEFQSLLIYEPNPEFFAISLYFVDYEKIYDKLKGRFFIQIGGELKDEIVEKFLYERVVSSTFLQLILKTYNHPLIEKANNKFANFAASKVRGWGTFEDEIIGIKNHLKNINKYKLLMKKQNLNVPICVVANGKSLENSIDWIKKNKDSMIIFSVGTALKPLIKAGIESDFHIEQERIPTLIQALKDILPNYNGYFIGASVVRNEVFKMAKKPLMYIRSGFTFEDFYKTPVHSSSPLVGNAGVAIASMFSKEIYLVGMDLGFRLNQKKHASNSFYDNLEDTQTIGLKVEGNFSDDIYTDSLFLSSKESIEKLIAGKNLKVYNLSDGAYIKGAIPLKDISLPKIDKKTIISKMLNSFENTNFKNPSINPKNLLLSISVAMDKKVSNYKKLTGLIDFLEDLIKDYSLIDAKSYTLLKGSLWHILFNLHVLTHKINIKDYNKLSKIVKKEVFKYLEYLKTLEALGLEVK